MTRTTIRIIPLTAYLPTAYMDITRIPPMHVRRTVTGARNIFTMASLLESVPGSGGDLDRASALGSAISMTSVGLEVSEASASEILDTKAGYGTSGVVMTSEVVMNSEAVTASVVVMTSKVATASAGDTASKAATSSAVVTASKVAMASRAVTAKVAAAHTAGAASTAVMARVVAAHTAVVMADTVRGSSRLQQKGG